MDDCEEVVLSGVLEGVIWKMKEQVTACSLYDVLDRQLVVILRSVQLNVAQPQCFLLAFKDLRKESDWSQSLLRKPHQH